MLDSALQSELLQLYPMLGAMPPAQRDALLSQAQLMRIPAGTIIFDENQPCQGFPFMLSGSVRVIKSSPNGRELQLYRVCPGESCILTSSCLLGHTKYHARGIVECDTQLVFLPAPAFRALFSGFEPFRDYVFNLFSERLTDLMQLVSAVAFQKLDQRLAAHLLTKNSPIHTTHQALADELGSAREMVSRLLKNFAEHGWVRLGREMIDITDPLALKRFSEM